MKKPRIIFRWMRRVLRRRLGSPPHSLSSIDPKEFSNLLCSGRKDDLKLLANKLSAHTASPRRAVAGRGAKPASTTSRNGR
jgi:hypothetical protein